MRLENWIENSCQKHSDRIAITDVNKNYTYRELYERYQYYADYIQSCTNGVSCNIVIHMRKSFEYVALIFAILKSNCTYVPVDSSVPKKQIEYIINDINAAIVFSDIDSILCESSCYWLNVNKNNDIKLCNACKANKDIAYILFTSGSTGWPKGIKISHFASLQFIIWAMKYLPLSQEDVFSSHAPFSFDLSIFDIFVSLFLGAKLSLMSSGINAFTKSVAKYIRENKITVWYSVPSVIMKLIDLGQGDVFSNIRVLIYAGESMPYEYVNKLNCLYPNLSIYNFYGPTETNVITYYPIEKNTKFDGEIPIGYPCPYAEVVIKDEHELKTCVGDIGELCVKSSTLMSGYHNRNTIQDEYYRTGDLVKIVSENCYEYIGRLDNMVKVNGFRVELEEVERAIEGYSAVKQAVVNVKRVGTEDILFARISAHCDIDIQALCKYLYSVIQSYKVPKEFFVVDEILVNDRGKKVR